MNMQDKELDELFRSKLGGIEMQPSAHIWTNIAAELGGEKKRSVAPILRIAAAVLVLLSVGTWFLVGNTNKEEQAQVASRINKPVQVKQVQPQPTTIEQPVVSKDVQTEPIVTKQAIQLASVKHQPITKPAVAPVENVTETTQKPVATTADQPAQVLAAVSTNNAVQNAVVPEMALSPKTIDTLPSALKTLNNTNPITVTAQQPVKKRRGIHSLGGLINAVVAKVDKREDKFIEFTETDEDNANVTGINLGLFKVKKDK